MTSMVHMPSMPPPAPCPTTTLRPGSPAHGYQHQGLSNVNHLPTGSAAGQNAAASNLSLALPLSNTAGPPQSAVIVPLPANSSAITNSLDSSIGLSRVKLVDMLPEDGAPSGLYTRTVETLSSSLARHNAVIIELSGEDATRVALGLESAKLYFRSRRGSGIAVATWGGPPDLPKSTGYAAASLRELYTYRAGRAGCEDVELPPPGMPEIFRCLGKASRASLSAIARHLRLRSDVFGSILDDFPLAPGEISSSLLTAASYHPPGTTGKSLIATEPGVEIEKGLLMLVASDTPGLQVCDPSGRWFLADNRVTPGDLILLTGKALQHATAGLRKASAYRVVPLSTNSPAGSSGRTSLAFRLMPRSSAVIDSSPVADAGHSVPDGYGTVSVASFMDDLTAAEALMSNGSEINFDALNPSLEPSLRSVLSDPLTGALLENAFVAHCGHSFGGETLRRVYETSMCTACGVAVEVNSLIPNFALREAASAFKREERSRQLQGSIRGAKRRKDPTEQTDIGRPKRQKQDHPNSPMEKENALRSGSGGKGVQFPFSVDERVMIKGNKRTPEKFVGREARITSQCLNGWYLLKTLDSGDSVRLQYRSLEKSVDHNGVSDEHPSQRAHQ